MSNQSPGGFAVQSHLSPSLSWPLPAARNSGLGRNPVSICVCFSVSSRCLWCLLAAKLLISPSTFAWVFCSLNLLRPNPRSRCVNLLLTFDAALKPSPPDRDPAIIPFFDSRFPNPAVQSCICLSSTQFSVFLPVPPFANPTLLIPFSTYAAQSPAPRPIRPPPTRLLEPNPRLAPHHQHHTASSRRILNK